MKIEEYIGRISDISPISSGKTEYRRVTKIKENKNKDRIVIDIKIEIPKDSKINKKIDEQSDKRYTQCLQYDNPWNIDKFGIVINKILKLTEGHGRR